MYLGNYVSGREWNKQPNQTKQTTHHHHTNQKKATHKPKQKHYQKKHKNQPTKQKHEKAQNCLPSKDNIWQEIFDVLSGDI